MYKHKARSEIVLKYEMYYPGLVHCTKPCENTTIVIANYSTKFKTNEFLIYKRMFNYTIT